MARKDLLKSVMDTETDNAASASRSSYAMRGASKSMKVSIDSLAENSRKMLDGETIVEIDPDTVFASFVRDRMDEDEVAFEELKASIKANGQETPILLRPHPKEPGKYMVVFGHRRLKAARELGRMVRAVVKEMDDVSHILAQGQENSVRANLSFIEKSVFARNLVEMGQTRDIIQEALTVDATLLSRMLSVAENVPWYVIDTIGPAKNIGRDRWEELKKLMSQPENVALAEREMAKDGFERIDSDTRFERVLSKITEAGRAPKRRAAKAAPKKRTWTAGEGRIKGVIGRSGKAYSISLTSKDSAAFGEFLSRNLDQLYEDFLAKNEEHEAS